MGANDKAETEPRDAYISYGHLDPHRADRLFRRFEQERVRFQFSNVSRVTTHTGTRFGRTNALELFIHQDDVETANRILGEDSSVQT